MDLNSAFRLRIALVDIDLDSPVPDKWISYFALESIG